jgi:hypothetical protein
MKFELPLLLNKGRSFEPSYNPLNAVSIPFVWDSFQYYLPTFPLEDFWPKLLALWCTYICLSVSVLYINFRSGRQIFMKPEMNNKSLMAVLLSYVLFYICKHEWKYEIKAPKITQFRVTIAMKYPTLTRCMNRIMQYGINKLIALCLIVSCLFCEFW